MVDNKMLVEKWTPIIESPKARTVKNKEVMARLLENQETYLNETAATTLGDFSQYTPIIVPATRRIVPNLLAQEIVGVQALNGPTGYAFALRFGYAGVGGKRDISQSSTNSPNYPNTTRGVQKNSQGFYGFAVVLANYDVLALNASGVPTNIIPVTVVNGTPTGSKVYLADGTTIGTVVYAERNKVLIDTQWIYSGTSTTPTAGTHYFENNIIKLNADGSVKQDVTAVGLDFGPIGTATPTITNPPVATIAFNNEAGYNLIFSSYIPSLATGTAEYLSRSQMKTMKMTMERFPVEAQTRKLKAEYSIELAQDLKAVHGLDAEAELINILEYEITAELDRELVAAIYANTTNAGKWSYGTAGIYTGGVTPVGTGATPASAFYGVADGRNELEKFRTLYTRIVREANAVAISTRRGAANFIICSLNVATALETLQNFMYSAVPGNVETTIGVAKIGTLDGRFTVYLDTFAYDDFFVVGYKGNTAFDSGIIYCPYVPLMIQKVTDPDTFQPLVGMQTRDAIVGNMWGAEKYYRKVTCDFTGSSLISGNYYVGSISGTDLTSY